MEQIVNYHYYLPGRGDPKQTSGYQAFVTDFRPDGSLKRQYQVHIDDALKADKRDKDAKALRKRAVAALQICAADHGASHVVTPIGGTDRPPAFNISCRQDRGGCGNQWVSLDKTGMTPPPK